MSSVERLESSDMFTTITLDTDINPRPRALWVTVSGNLVCKNKAGTSVTFPVVAGTVVPISPKQVTSASTATALALF